MKYLLGQLKNYEILKMKAKLVIFLSLSIIWMLLTGSKFDPWEIFLSLFISAVICAYCAYLEVLPHKIVFKLNSILYIFWLLKEVIVSSTQVSLIAWKRNIQISPRLKAIKTSQTNDYGLNIFANSITLTPGTVSLSTDQKEFILVHALDAPFMDGLEEGDMDLRVKKIIR